MIIEIPAIKFEVNDVAAGPMNWHDANKHAESLGDGWRLPTMVELDYIYQNKDKLPAVDGLGRSSTNAIWVWSSETHPDYRNYARIRSMANGNDHWVSKGYDGISVVAVRSVE